MSNFASINLTHGETNALVKLVGGEDKVRKILFGEFRIQLLSTSSEAAVASEPLDQTLTVLADTSFEDRITRGNYSWRNSDLTEKKFPVTAEQVGDWEWKLFHFDCNISSEEALRLMREEGYYDGGQIGHLLAFGEKYPEEQRKYPIIGLGSVVKIRLYRDVPGLWHDHGRRGLNLHWFDFGWSRCCRFLGVRRRSVA